MNPQEILSNLEKEMKACGILKINKLDGYDFLYVNHGFQDLFGVTISELSLDRFNEMLDLNVEHKGSSVLINSKELESDVQISRSCKTKNGQTINCEIDISFILDSGCSQSEIVLQFLIYPDSTSNSLIEKKQKEILCRMGSMAEIGGWEIDFEKNIQICSPGVISIREDNPEKIVVPMEYGMNFYPQEYKNQISNSMQKLIQFGEAFEMEAQMITLNNNKKWVKFRAVPKYENDKVVKAFGLIQDITYEKTQKESIVETTRKLENFKYALDHSSIVAITNQEGEIEYANENFCQMSGYTLGELLGNSHRLLNSGYHPREFFIELWRTISSGRIWKGEIKNKAKDGSFYWVDTYIVPILDHKQRPKQYLSIRHNITQRKEQEALIKESLEEKEILLNEIHHRVKNNLQIVSSLMTLQGRFLKDPKLIGLYKDMQNRIIVMSLIHDTIYNTKNYKRINAEFYISSIVRNVQESLTANSIEMSLEVDQNISMGVSTATNVGIILNEAISNSIKYAFEEMDEAGRIHVKLRADENKPHYFILEISDNGCGIKNYEELRIIERTSLGLTLIEGLTEQMMGRVEVSNENGCHLKLTFYDNRKS